MLRLTEVYVSTQGEGPNVGDPTCFIRFGGCNLRCPLWPCDSQFAIDTKKYRHLWKKYEVPDLVQEILAVTGFDRNVRLCFTGGEPMLQPNDELHALVNAMKSHGYFKFEMFSNGTLPYPRWRTNQVPVILDWKLPGSGEDPYNKIRIEENVPFLTAYDSIKFVCADEEDYNEAGRLWLKHIVDHTDAQVYYGVAWNKLDPAKLVEWVLRDHLPWKLNLQVHNLIWDPAERGR